MTGAALTGALRGSDHAPQPHLHGAIARIIKQHPASNSDIDQIAAGRYAPLDKLLAC